MESTNEIALSDFSFFSRVIITLVWLLKSSVVFFIFFVLIPLKYFLASASREYYLLVFIGMIMAYSLIFLIYYVISEGILKEMFFGFVLTIIGTIVAFFIPPVGAIIAIIGIISMIRKIISVAKMIPMLLLGALFAVLLFSEELFMPDGLSKSDIFTVARWFNFSFPITYAKVVYITLSVITSLVLGFKYSLKNAMLRQVVILMAIPITALIIWLIKTSLSRAFYRPSEMQQVSVHKGKVFVNDYFRGDGTLVHSYHRRLPLKHHFTHM